MRTVDVVFFNTEPIGHKVANVYETKGIVLVEGARPSRHIVRLLGNGGPTVNVQLNVGNISQQRRILPHSIVDIPFVISEGDGEFTIEVYNLNGELVEVQKFLSQTTIEIEGRGITPFGLRETWELREELI